VSAGALTVHLALQIPTEALADAGYAGNLVVAIGDDAQIGVGAASPTTGHATSSATGVEPPRA
jgi:hypothetical protein